MTEALARAARQPQPLPDNAPHVLIVDDDQRIRDLLASFLQHNGFRVTTAGHVEAARSAMRGLAFDLVILDVMMPGELNGIGFARELKGQSRIPILMLTALSEAGNRIQGLEAGVDDYLGKPFEPRELLLRLNNILKRQQGDLTPKDEIKMGEYAFHITRGELRRGEESIKLTERERDLMRLFAARRGSTIPRHELITGETTGSERAVDVQINRLRRKIETDPANPIYLQTVRGKGYILHTD